MRSRFLIICGIAITAACSAPEQSDPYQPPASFASKLPPPLEGSVKVLFIGNSHTGVNDVPGQVRSLLASSSKKIEIAPQTISCGHLDDVANDPELMKRVTGTKWAFVVLQAARISSSHKYEYSQEKAIEVAKAALKNGSKVLYFSEWPQKGMDESEYIHSHYRQIAKNAKGGQVLPIGFVWDKVLEVEPKAELWFSDGNHAALPGSYVAACVISQWIAGPDSKLEWKPDGVDDKLASKIRDLAQTRVRQELAKASG